MLDELALQLLIPLFRCLQCLHTSIVTLPQMTTFTRCSTHTCTYNINANYPFESVYLSVHVGCCNGWLFLFLFDILTLHLKLVQLMITPIHFLYNIHTCTYENDLWRRDYNAYWARENLKWMYMHVVLTKLFSLHVHVYYSKRESTMPKACTWIAEL